MNDDNQAPIEIPFEQLSPDALRGVAEAFVLREGTDYGFHDFSMEQKVEHVVAQLKRGDATIVFDAQSETIGLVTKHELGGISDRTAESEDDSSDN